MIQQNNNPEQDNTQQQGNNQQQDNKQQQDNTQQQGSNRQQENGGNQNSGSGNSSGNQRQTGDNTIKNPDNWTTGDQPMTGAQNSYLHTLASEAGVEIEENLTKAEASKKIDELQHKTGRGLEGSDDSA